MTLEQKAAQLFVVTPEAITGVPTATRASVATRDALEQYPVGGIVYFAKNLVGEAQTQEMLANTQRYAKEITGLPAFLCVDEEGGTVARIGGNSGFAVKNVGDMRDVGATGDTLTSVAVDTDGSVYAAGNFTSSGANSLFTSYGRADAGLVKFSSSGEQQWVQQFGGSRADNFLAVTAASDGGCVAVGRSASRDRTMSKLSNNGGYDAIMVKYNADGSIAWQSVVHGLLDDCFTGVCATEDGYALAGYTNSSNSDFRKVGNRGGTDAFLVRTDASGKVLENTLQSYGGTRDDRFNGICALESGELVACGATLSTDGDLVGSAPASDGKNTVGMIARFEAAKD